MNYNLLLADDDEDDCLFFKEALSFLPFNVNLSIVNDGGALMKFLSDNLQNLPDILFLDLNMPRKNGFECLLEIKMIAELQNLPIIVFSTSLDPIIVDSVFERCAIYYIRKPCDFAKLKKVIYDALMITRENNFQQPERANFILQA